MFSGNGFFPHVVDDFPALRPAPVSAREKVKISTTSPFHGRRGRGDDITNGIKFNSMFCLETEVVRVLGPEMVKESKSRRSCKQIETNIRFIINL